MTTVPKFISQKALQEQLGLSRQTIHRMRKTNKIPQPTQIGTNRIGWAENVINEWLDKGGVAQ